MHAGRLTTQRLLCRVTGGGYFVEEWQVPGLQPEVISDYCCGKGGSKTLIACLTTV
jgi:hypothetical protein